jgi:bifunctional non-homologous end joining protein LigD
MTHLAPMLASVGASLPTGDGWVFEPKYDGIRVLGEAMSDRVSLITRNGLDKAKQFPEVVDALRVVRRRAKRNFVVDGEIVAMRGDVPARFQELQGRMHVTDATAIEGHRTGTPTALFVFDILLDGKTPLITEPWRTRRKYLAELLKPPARSSALRLSDVSDDGAAMLKEATRRGWEGIMAKRADASYAPGERTRAWLKLKIEHRQEFVVGGWTEPRKSREFFGALLLGYYDGDGAFTYAGHTGTGFTRAGLLDLHQRLRRLERRTSPFDPTPRTNEPAHWVRPSIVVEIKFNEWTTDGRLRQPVFVGVRDDKAARDVGREPGSIPQSASARAGSVRKRPVRRVAASVISPRARKTKTKYASTATSVTANDAEDVARQIETIEREGGSGVLELPSGSLDVSNLDKVFFPSTKQTKGDLMRFYARLAPSLLPAIADRPLVMKRFPNGILGKAFYQQKAPANPPPGVRIAPVSDEGLTTQDRLIGGDLTTLLYLVQLGAISVDPWHSRVQSIQFADYSIIDLDPGPRAPFSRVVEVARAVKDVLDTYQLHAIPKTSGASGIHIVLPLGDGVPNDGSRMIAELVATAVATRNPKIATIERWVKSRPSGAVYVDFLQNIRGKTVAGVYSVRAQPRATVSTPLAWDEVTDGLDPDAFTMDEVRRRMTDVGDLWGAGMRHPNTLEGLIGRA